MPRQVTGKFILSLVPQGDADSALALLNKPWGNSGSPEYIRHSFFSQQGDEIFLATSGNPYDDYVSKSMAFVSSAGPCKMNAMKRLGIS